MQRLAFILIYPLLLGLSKLPFWLFYRVSDCCYFIVYYIIRYRRNVVDSNLKRVFPNKTNSEIAKIRKGFYKHMCDMFLEMIKTLSISDKELKKRFVYTNLEALRELENLNKGNIIMCAHYASYEWILSAAFYNFKYKTYGIYKKIKNPYFDKLVKDIRSRYDSTIITTLETPKTMMRNKAKGTLASYGMIADQAPKGGKTDYWREFMGINTPVFVGSEVLAKRLDLAVTYLHIEKVKRGHYAATFKTITTEPKTVENYKITDAYFNYLEDQIREKPEHYLWTHKRWKHKRPVNS
jgi:KDO2-lipid IV(A) lauroyltransferase